MRKTIGDLISVVINTRNEEKNLKRAIDSVKDWAGEVVVVDMKSDDGTVKLAKELGAKVFSHRQMHYVEPARNFAISKATGDWVLVLDADEEATDELKKKLEVYVGEEFDGNSVAFVRVPRKNIVFGKWLKHSRWWPDYNIRFFRKGYVKWNEQIHSVPFTKGRGLDLPAEESLALVHHHYDSVSQFVLRMDRYTTQQLNILRDEGYVFHWQDLIRKPVGEFLSRFFAGEGYKDGLHGLSMAMLQAFSELVLYLKVWEDGGFDEKQVSLTEFSVVWRKSAKDLIWWLTKSYRSQGSWIKSLKWSIKRRIF